MERLNAFWSVIRNFVSRRNHSEDYSVVFISYGEEECNFVSDKFIIAVVVMQKLSLAITNWLIMPRTSLWLSSCHGREKLLTFLQMLERF